MTSLCVVALASVGTALLSAMFAQEIWSGDTILFFLICAALTASGAFVTTLMGKTHPEIETPRVYGSQPDRAVANMALDSKTRDFDLLFENVPVRLWIKDDANTIVRLNRAAAESMGVSVAEAEGRNTAELFPEIADKYLKDDLAVINSGVAMTGIIEEYAPSSGVRGWVRTDKVPIIDPTTGQRYVIVAAIDVTDWQQAQNALKESELRFSTAAAGSSVGIWDWIDIKGNKEYWTPRQFELLGYEPYAFEPNFSKFLELLHPDDHVQLHQAVEAHFQDRIPFQIEYRLRHRTKGYRWFLGSGQAIWDDNGEPKRMIGSIMDIHERKEAEEALSAKAAALARSNLELEQFARVASHDLRAPLRGIANIVGWLEEDLADHFSEDTKGHLTLLTQRVGRMEKLLDDILAFSRLEFDGPTETIDTTNAIEDAFALVQTENFTLRFDGAMPKLQAERVLVELVFRNLLDNSIKHHDRDSGTITISAHAIGNGAEFRICDDGPGIDPRFSEKIFQIFQQLKIRDANSGSGMGLAFVKKVMDEVGGSIKLEPRAPEERGAVFILTWPDPARQASKAA